MRARPECGSAFLRACLSCGNMSRAGKGASLGLSVCLIRSCVRRAGVLQ